MAASTWMTNPAPDELLFMGAFVLAGSVVTNTFLKAPTGREKGLLLMASGISTLIMIAVGNALCEGSKKGLCEHVPTTVWE